MKLVYLIGIGGSGLSAIARLLLESGYSVMGSDQSVSPITRELEQMGAQIFTGHEGDHVKDADLVLRSSAIPEDNPELLAARASGIPVLKRSEFLEEFLQAQSTIAIAGTHGKTTTTAMIAWMLTALKLDPSYLIGGVSKNLGTNAHAGKGGLFVIEGDEYDYMFLGLQPILGVITNIDHDHPDLFPTMASYTQAFARFTGKIPHGGRLLCTINVSNLLQGQFSAGLEVITFGMEPHAHYRAEEVDILPNGCRAFTMVHSPSENILARVNLQVPGKHNIWNAMAALSTVHLLGLSVSEAAEHLQQFNGVERRFEVKGNVAGITFIDDYAHNPAKIRAALQAARDKFPSRRIIAVWQPHTFSRSITLFPSFLEAFEDADEVWMTEVYAARESDPTFSAAQFASALNSKKARFIARMPAMIDALEESLQHGDVLIVLSAGDATTINEHLIQRLSSNAKEEDHVTQDPRSESRGS